MFAFLRLIHKLFGYKREKCPELISVFRIASTSCAGLRIAPPEAPVTGYMFGKGVYFADMVSKSANYCCTHSGDPVGVLLLSEVLLDHNFGAHVKLYDFSSIYVCSIL